MDSGKLITLALFLRANAHRLSALFLPTTLAKQLQHFLITMAAFTALGLSTFAQAATINHTLYMTEKDTSFTIDFAGKAYNRVVWVEGFTKTSGGAPVVGGVTLNANEGDTVNITVINQTNDDHEFEVRGSGVAKKLVPKNGGSTVVTIVNPLAGSYIYHDPLVVASPKKENRSVGMAGALIIRPAGQGALFDAPGTLWSGGTSVPFTKQYTWVLSDFDKLWNLAARNGTAAPALYKATYAFINGDFGHTSLKNKYNSPKVIKDDVVLIRVVNPGMIAHPLHFHGYHGKLWRKNNVKQDSATAQVVEKDVVDVGPMETVDLVFHINQPGMYIIHDHTGMMVTQDGIYAEGMLAEFDACTLWTPAMLTGFTTNTPLTNVCDKWCPKPNIGVPNCP